MTSITQELLEAIADFEHSTVNKEVPDSHAVALFALAIAIGSGCKLIASSIHALASAVRK